MRKERRQIYIHCDVKHSVGRGYASRDRTTAPKWKILSDFLHKLLIEFDVRSGCCSRNKFSMRHLNTLLDLKIPNFWSPINRQLGHLSPVPHLLPLNFGEHEMKLNKFHFLTFFHSYSPSYRLVAEPKNVLFSFIADTFLPTEVESSWGFELWQRVEVREQEKGYFYLVSLILEGNSIHNTISTLAPLLYLLYHLDIISKFMILNAHISCWLCRLQLILGLPWRNKQFSFHFSCDPLHKCLLGSGRF